MAKVYLAGPITGCSWGESEDWRDRVKKGLEDTAPHIKGYSPLREKGFLMNESNIKDSYGDTIFSNQKAIMSRDFFDVNTADAVIANFTGSKIVSIGTVMECGWAFQKRIPLIVISEMKDGKPDNIHSHSMLREAANWWVPSEEDALDIIRTLFTP